MGTAIGQSAVAVDPARDRLQPQSHASAKTMPGSGLTANHRWW
jgi:hypothetical protein